MNLPDKKAWTILVRINIAFKEMEGEKSRKVRPSSRRSSMKDKFKLDNLNFPQMCLGLISAFIDIILFAELVVPFLPLPIFRLRSDFKACPTSPSQRESSSLSPLKLTRTSSLSRFTTPPYLAL